MHPPIAIVINSPPKKLCVSELKMTPNKEANSSIPSSAMLVIPDFAAIPDASVANRIGVEARRIAFRKSGDRIFFNILFPLLFFQGGNRFFCNHPMPVSAQKLLRYDEQDDDSLCDLHDLKRDICIPRHD